MRYWSGFSLLDTFFGSGLAAGTGTEFVEVVEEEEAVDVVEDDELCVFVGTGAALAGGLAAAGLVSVFAGATGAADGTGDPSTAVIIFRL